MNRFPNPLTSIPAAPHRLPRTSSPAYPVLSHQVSRTFSPDRPETLVYQGFTMALTFLTWFKGVYFYISQDKSSELSERSS